MNDDKEPEKPFFPPVSEAKRAIPLPANFDFKNRLRFSDLSVMESEIEPATEVQIRNLIISSIARHTIEKLLSLEIASEEKDVVQTILAEAPPCEICRYEGRPNHLIQYRIRNAWLLSDTLKEDSVYKIEKLIELDGQGQRDRYFNSDIVEEIQSIYFDAYAQPDKISHLNREINKGRKIRRELKHLNSLLNQIDFEEKELVAEE